MERLLAPRRRMWLLLTLAVITAMYTWTSVRELAVLIEAEPEALDGQEGTSLIRLAEHNIARHLHIPQRLSKFRGMVGNELPSGTVALASGQQQQQQGAQQKHEPAKQAAGSGAAAAGTAGSGSSSSSGTAGAGAAAAASGACANMLKHTDYWGDALVSGFGNKKETAADCCASCAAYKPDASKDGLTCNVWVYCEDAALCKEHHKECWLKHLPHPYGTAPAKEGPEVGWTTGIMTAQEEIKPTAGGAERKYHVVVTAAGSAVHWQSRVGYYWFKKIRKQCEAAGNCHMGGFTRLLHTGKPDDLMNEIPTWVAQPLPPEHPDHGYIVLNRPYALMQWVQQVTIPEKYVLMSEPDHVWLKPMPNLMRGEHPAAFPFFYIEPSRKDFLHITQKFVGPITLAESEEIAPVGNAPTFLSWENMKTVMPLFFNMSISVHNDAEANKEWGWVQEMYAFTLAVYKAGIRGVDLYLKLMSQPPYDEKLGPYYILHYTYGMDYTKEGVFTPGKIGEWRFDKRSYSVMPPPRNLSEPPAGMKNELVRHLIHCFNEATSVIPGWDSYHKTGVATEWWDGVVKD